MPSNTSNNGTNIAHGASATTTKTTMSHKERLRAAVRGALGSHHPHEEDISDSVFLGKADGTMTAANKAPQAAVANTAGVNDPTPHEQHIEGGTLVSASQESSHDSNPVDEM